MFFKFQPFTTIGIIVFLYVINNCHGQFNPIAKVSGGVKHVAIDIKNVGSSVVDSCSKLGECVRQKGENLVNETVTSAKETVAKISISSIADMISKSKCVIPKNADNIVRATLLQQCISPNHGFGNETRCFSELGCFPMEHPWTSNLRPFPSPMKPDEIELKLYAYSRNTKERYNVTLWPKIILEGSDFKADREFTAFIIHGFNSDGENQWMSELKDAYLKNRDANVFLADWGKGSKLYNYLQVASNTRVVGAELVRFVKHLIDRYNLNPKKMHIMGHSLGAHISSYLAKGIPGVSRITAFDPAQPGFEGCPKEVRLDKSDAGFVDVIHTSARPTVPFLGFGLIEAVGHVDIYMNGGLVQPGCTLPPIEEVKLTSIADLAAVPADVVGLWVACSHGRSFSYFIESLNNNCTFWAQKTKILPALANIITIGQLQPVLIFVNKCKFHECVPIGIDADQYPGRGMFGGATAFFKPYCKKHDEVDKFMLSEFRKIKNIKN